MTEPLTFIKGNYRIEIAPGPGGGTAYVIVGTREHGVAILLDSTQANEVADKLKEISDGR